MILKDNKSQIDHKNYNSTLPNLFIYYEYSKPFVQPVIQAAAKYKQTQVSDIAHVVAPLVSIYLSDPLHLAQAGVC